MLRVVREVERERIALCCVGQKSIESARMPVVEIAWIEYQVVDLDESAVREIVQRRRIDLPVFVIRCARAPWPALEIGVRAKAAPVRTTERIAYKLIRTFEPRPRIRPRNAPHVFEDAVRQNDRTVSRIHSVELDPRIIGIVEVAKQRVVLIVSRLLRAGPMDHVGI